MVTVDHLVNAFWTDAVRRFDHTVVVALLAKGVRLHDARDLAQETWARLIAAHRDAKLERVELPGLAIRQAMFLLAERRRVELRRVEVPETEAHALAGEEEPESIAGTREVLAVVAAELERATPRAREVIDVALSANHGAHAEHAAALGVSVQRFRQILCAVRARLRAAVAEATR